MDEVRAFNAMPAGELAKDLLACCAAPAWGAAILAGRPYPDRSAILAAADVPLSWADVLTGLSNHPRIGERPGGDSKEAAWSRREQAASAGDALEDELVAANRAYEEKFGQVFLIFASGRSRAEIVAAARERLANDEETERAIVAEQLRLIARLRLERLLDALG